jgi:uncharacterized GH25 family protein
MRFRQIQIPSDDREKYPMLDFNAPTVSSARRFAWFILVGLLAAWGSAVTAPATLAHEVWVEIDPSARVGEEAEVRVYWGHAGNKETGERLAAQHGKLTAYVRSPRGRDVLKLAAEDDGFVGKFTPAAPGYYVAGADLQVGIIDRQVHSIPANTRIAMYGKAITRVAGEALEAPAPLGLEVEIVPVAPARQPAVGDLITVRVLHKGQPVGGRQVLVTASTSGSRTPTDDERVQNWEWSNQAMADPKTGEATFPLIVAGQHLFMVRYVDETPGTYQGPRNDSSDFSHLRPGDTYERTMHVSTLTLQVNEARR